MPMAAADREVLIADLQRLWTGWSDMRFGQILRLAVGYQAVLTPRELADATVVSGVTDALRDKPGRQPPPGPYWDTEATRGRSFMNGLPRDPARIPRVLSALATAWEAHPSLTLGRVLDLALDSGGITDNEAHTRLLLIEDGPLRRVLVELS
jgi:hypothetical protein